MGKSLAILMLSLAGLTIGTTANAGVLSSLLDLLGLHSGHSCHVKCVASAPEIDPGSALGALTLLGGGLLVLRGRGDKK